MVALSTSGVDYTSQTVGGGWTGLCDTGDEQSPIDFSKNGNYDEKEHMDLNFHHVEILKDKKV